MAGHGTKGQICLISAGAVGNEAFKKEHFLAGAELHVKPVEDPVHVCRDPGFSVLVCSTIHVLLSPPHTGS